MEKGLTQGSQWSSEREGARGSEREREGARRSEREREGVWGSERDLRKMRARE